MLGGRGQPELLLAVACSNHRFWRHGHYAECYVLSSCIAAMQGQAGMSLLPRAQLATRLQGPGAWGLEGSACMSGI